ncbi:MAG TPA: hypothetical protein VGQ09_01225 [Chitinophagaceae bacterium]|jgi:hypothetical protein|nr:hypothetical protein [Chitinophagaceae bacterium]
MKIQTIATARTESKIMKPCYDSRQQLSDNAFYLIALTSLIKKIIFPVTLQDFLIPGKFVGLKNELLAD